MKTLLIALYHYNGQGLDSWIDHGAGITYTAAKQAGCDIDFLDMKELFSDEELKSHMKGYDLIAFGLKSSYYAIAMKVIKFAKELGSKTLVAGYHATAAPQELIENPDIDYIFYGESEITFPKFLKSPTSSREIYGIKPNDLDTVPFIDRSIYREPTENCLGWWYGNKLSKMVTVMAARGCPYKCAFCQPLENNHFGKRLRRRSVDNLIKELRQLKSLYNPECVMIHDDTFLLQPKWLEEFILKYPEIGLPFWASGRADGICKHPDLVKRLVDVGWDLISVGFESGSQRILNKLKKGTTVEQNLESARIIKSAGAKIYANYITAIPWETDWDIQATHKMADEINAEMPSWAYFTPYPGCELGEECINKGWSLLDRNSYDRCPSGIKVKHVDYNYISKVRQGLRHNPHPEFTDIIIPCYNNEHLTIDCINSIKECTTECKYRIILVDNASKEVDKVEEVLKDTNHLLIKNSTNLGFVGAVNKGLEKSDAPNVCLLNNDTVVSPRWLDKLTKTLHSSSDLGIVGSMTDYSKNKGMDSHHCLTLHNSLLPPDAINWDLEKINRNLEKLYSGRTHKVSFVAFLCAVIKREVIDKVGHLDPNYEMGMWDDLDYNRSVRSRGYRTELCLDTCIKHFGRSTFNKIQAEENFDVGTLLKSNREYLDNKWRKLNAVKENYSDLGNRLFIISRAIYNKMGEKTDIGILTEDRLEIMQRYFINSLKNQIDKDFTIYLVVGEFENETTKRIEGLNWEGLDIKYIYTNGEIEEWKRSVLRSKNWGVETDIGSPEDIVRKSGHPKSNIMARLDTDDWVVPGWTAHIRYMVESNPESHFLINYQVIGQDIDGRLYNFNNGHNRARTSPFIVLVQKDSPRISPYEYSHIRMGSKFATVYNIPPAYVFMVLHKGNRSNKFYLKDSYLEELEEDPKVKPKKPIDFLNIKGTGWRDRIRRARVN